MANKLKGEIGINIFDKEYLLTPSFGALAEIETELDKTLYQIIGNFDQTPFNLKELCKIIAIGIKGSGEIPPDQETIGKAVLDMGLGKAYGSALKFLLNGAVKGV